MGRSNTTHVAVQPASPQRTVQGKYWTISLHAAALILPMLVLPTVLLGLVYHYKVASRDESLPGLAIPGQPVGDGTLFVDYSPTRLVFIASWSSSLASILAGSILALVSFSASQHLRPADPELLSNPTPYQLALILAILNGSGVGALLQWLRYLWGWRRSRQHHGAALKVVATTLVMAMLLKHVHKLNRCTLCVVLADTWLHLTVTTGPLVLVDALPVGPKYGFGLDQPCWNWTPTGNGDSDAAADCYPVHFAATNTFLQNASISYAVLANVSSTTMITTLDVKQPFAYMVVPGNGALASVDYTATTYAVQTQCEPVSRKCNLIAYDGADTYYYCTDAFMGSYMMDSSGGELYLPHFTNAQMTNVTDYELSGISNPYYFGQVAGFSGLSSATRDPEIVVPIHGGMAFILACNATIYDVEYDVVNSTITRFVTQRSNDSVAKLVAAPMDATAAATPFLQQAAVAAALANDSMQMAEMMALSYSKAALAVFAQVTTPIPALQAQQRTEMLVAKVPVAPLYAQVVADLLYVLVGLVLTVVALKEARGDTRELQARLGIETIVADLFEVEKSKEPVRDVGELFEEKDGKASRRVRLVKTAEGGRCYEAVATGMDDEASGDDVEMDLLPRALTATSLGRETR